MKPTQQHHASKQMSLVSATALLDKAKAFIYAQRCEDKAHSDIWALSLHWRPYTDRRCHHSTLLALCARLVKDPRVLERLSQYMNRVEIHRGEHHLIDLGVAKGCPLSPLMGALVLKSLDKMIPPGCAYARYMDDWVILTHTRRQLRQVVKNMHAIVHGLKMKLALKKTFIGRISKGFDFLGYRFGALGLTGLAQQTIDNHKQKLLLLYEQSASDQRVEKYVSNWKRWMGSGLAGV